jgi:starch synthase
MKILIAASEAVPYAKTGGLADVAGALLKEHRKAGREAYLILPLYRRVKEHFDLTYTGRKVTVPVGGRKISGRIFSHENISFFIECDEFFDRSELYGTADGDYPDNAARFIFFDRAVAEACIALNIRPDIIHCNDWQTGLLPFYLKTIYKSAVFGGTVTMMTLHNLGYQGLFDAVDFALTGLPPRLFTPEGLEFFGKMNLLKAGLIGSEIITTVSETYAREILTPEYGFGLEGVLRKRSSDLYGVINGIDSQEWDPGQDRLIASTYGPSALTGKASCKSELIKECYLDPHDRKSPLIALVGRLSAQKGLDILIESLDDIVSMGARLVVLGKGDDTIQKSVTTAAEKYKGRIFLKVGYDESFAHRIYAGSDMFLMPSRYEPCGLGQLISMRYGTIPVARRTGGLADTIEEYEPLKHLGTGFLFDDYLASSLIGCVRLALCAYVQRSRWKEMVGRAMERDFSWRNSAERYYNLYETALAGKKE